MNSNQILRFVIQEYGELIDIENLYENFKFKVLKIKNSTELQEKEKEELIGIFKWGIREIQEGQITKEKAKENIIKRLDIKI